MAHRELKKSRGGYAAPPTSPAVRSLLPSFSSLLPGQRHRERLQHLTRKQPSAAGHPDPQPRRSFSDARDVLFSSWIDSSDGDDDGRDDDLDVLAMPLVGVSSSEEEESMEDEQEDEQEDDLFRPWRLSAASPAAVHPGSPDWTLPHYHGGNLPDQEAILPDLNASKCRDDFSTSDEEEDEQEEDSLPEEDLFSWAVEEQAKEEVVMFDLPPGLQDVLCYEENDADDEDDEEEALAASPDIFCRLNMDLACSDSEEEDVDVEKEDEEVAAILESPRVAHLQQSLESGRTKPLPPTETSTPLVSPSHPGGGSVTGTAAASCVSGTPGGSTDDDTPSVPSSFRRRRAPRRTLPALTPFQQALMDMAFQQNIYVGSRRHHNLARGMNLSPSVIMGYFQKWRKNGFRQLHRLGMSGHVDKIRRLHRSTLRYHQGRPASTSPASHRSLPGSPEMPVRSLPPLHTQQHQVAVGELQDTVQALVLQPQDLTTSSSRSPPTLQPQVAVSMSSSAWGIQQALELKQLTLCRYQFNSPWVYQHAATQ